MKTIPLLTLLTALYFSGAQTSGIIVPIVRWREVMKWEQPNRKCR